MKVCPKCGEEKSLDAFCRHRGTKDGLSCWCRSCQGAVAAANYRANAEKKKAASAAWRAANRERHRAYSRQWGEANQERVIDRSRAWALANPERAAANKAKYRERHPERDQSNRRAAAQRRRAIKAQALFERFDPIEVLERDGWRCHLCGIATPKRFVARMILERQNSTISSHSRPGASIA